jgi:hypothetical protein
MYTADLPTSPTTTIATFADDPAVLATDSDPAVASQKLQTHLLAIQIWPQKWRMQANALKSVHVTFKAEALPINKRVRFQGYTADLYWVRPQFESRPDVVYGG